MYHCSCCGKLICMKDAPEAVPVCCNNRMILKKDSRWDDMLSNRPAVNNVSGSKSPVSVVNNDSGPKDPVSAINNDNRPKGPVSAVKGRKYENRGGIDMAELEKLVKMFENDGETGRKDGKEYIDMSLSELTALIRIAALLTCVNNACSLNPRRTE